MKNKLVLAFVIFVVGEIVSNLLFNHVNAWIGVISFLGTLGGFCWAVYRYYFQT